MTITQVNLGDELRKYDLPEGTDIVTLMNEACSRAKIREEPKVRFYIELTLFGDSYATNPSMLGRNLKGRLCYPHVTARVQDDQPFFEIIASKEQLHKTFRARIKAALKEDGIFRCKLTAMPKSYRHRPGLMASIMTTELEQTVTLIPTKEGYAKWKVLTYR